MKDLLVTLLILLLSVFLGLYGPEALGFDTSLRYVYAALFLSLCLVVQEAILRHREYNRMSLGFEALSTVMAEGLRDVQKLKEDLAILTKKIEAQYAEKSYLEAVKTEVDVLQNLVTQLSGRVGRRLVKKTAAKIAKPPANREILLESVRDALRCDRVDLYLQPIVTLPQRKVRFYECFSRIRNQKGEIIVPEHYIEAAEQEGLIGAIDNMLLFRCVQLIRKAQKKHAHAGFFCNLPQNTLTDVHFFGDFVDFLKESPELARSLTFEISQADFDGRNKEIADLLKQLISTGAQLCLQKVTSLRFNLPELKKFGIKLIKVEAEKLMPYTVGKTPALDLNALKLEMDRLEIDLVVEKIEKENILLDLLDYSIDYGQGYLFGEPFYMENT